MLLSMTGFGEARHRSDSLELAIEIRTLNNRYLKMNVRGSDPYPHLESDLEKIVRQYIRRGTVQVRIRCQREQSGQAYRLNIPVIQSYLQQLQDICQTADLQTRFPMLVPQVLHLPGVLQEEITTDALAEDEWALVEHTLREALTRLQAMRRDEGQAMTEELEKLRLSVQHEVDHIFTYLPTMLEGYRQRLAERVQQILREVNIQLHPNDLVREVALFAERTDISEEITRLHSHLDQFAAIIRNDHEAPGRKLEFVTQEMFRETNTIGAKSGDTQISRHAVNIKTTLEKIKELIQNIE